MVCSAAESGQYDSIALLAAAQVGCSQKPICTKSNENAAVLEMCANAALIINGSLVWFQTIQELLGCSLTSCQL